MAGSDHKKLTQMEQLKKLPVKVSGINSKQLFRLIGSKSERGLGAKTSILERLNLSEI